MKKEIKPGDNAADSTTPWKGKNVMNTGNNVAGINKEDAEEFAHRKKISKQVAEAELKEEEEREIRKANRISDSGVRDDDDDGTDAAFEDEIDGPDLIGP